MKEIEKIKEEWNKRCNYIKESKNVDTEEIFNFFKPYLSLQSSKGISDEEIRERAVGILYKRCDASDENTWLDSDNFYKAVDEIIILFRSKLSEGKSKPEISMRLGYVKQLSEGSKTNGGKKLIEQIEHLREMKAHNQLTEHGLKTLAELELKLLPSELSNQTDAVDYLAFTEWVGKNYELVHGYKNWKWVALTEGILIHGSEDYYEKLITEYGKTTEQLYQEYKSLKQK